MSLGAGTKTFGPCLHTQTLPTPDGGARGTGSVGPAAAQPALPFLTVRPLAAGSPPRAGATLTPALLSSKSAAAHLVPWTG